jgi:hypothetical protein
MNVLAAYVGDANGWLFNSKNCKIEKRKRKKKDLTSDPSKLIMQGYRGKEAIIDDDAGIKFRLPRGIRASKEMKTKPHCGTPDI